MKWEFIEKPWQPGFMPDYCTWHSVFFFSDLLKTRHSSRRTIRESSSTSIDLPFVRTKLELWARDKKLFLLFVKRRKSAPKQIYPSSRHVEKISKRTNASFIRETTVCVVVKASMEESVRNIERQCGFEFLWCITEDSTETAMMCACFLEITRSYSTFTKSMFLSEGFGVKKMF